MKPDCIGHDDFAVMRKTKPAARRIERFKEAILRRDLAVSQGVEQGRFARIGVTDNGEYRKPLAHTSGSALVLVAGHIVDLPLQMRDAVTDAAAIRLQLGFTWTARADSASKT